MSDHNKLGVSGHLEDLISKASHVRFVKWRIDLVQQTERRRTIMEDAQDDDVITRVDSTDVPHAGDLSRAIAKLAPGSKVDLTVRRGRET